MADNSKKKKNVSAELLMGRVRGAALKKCDSYLYRNSQCGVEPAGLLALPWMEC